MALSSDTGNTSAESNAEKVRFAAIITFVFIVLASFVNVFHEPWRDETQAWLLARDQPTLKALSVELHRVGHPHVWYVLLRFVSGLGDYWVVKVINLGFTTAAVWLVLRFAPFSRLTRALVVFGYLPLFEYGVIARNYSIGIFLLFLFTALFPRRRSQPWLLALILALAANTSVHAAFISVGALSLLVFEWFSLSDEERGKSGRVAFWFAVAIVIAGLATCAVSIIPPPDFRLANFWHARPATERLGATFRALVQAFTSVPWLTTPGVPSLKSLRIPVMIVGVPLSVLFTIVVSLTLATRKLVWVLAVVSCGILLAFFFDRYYGGARHSGFLLVAVLMALWLAPIFPAQTPFPKMLRVHDWVNRNFTKVMNVTFAWHAVGAIFAICVDCLFVFSAGSGTAQLIRERRLEALPLIVNRDVLASSIVSYLGGKQAYFANVNCWGTYVIQDGRHGKNNGYAAAPEDKEIFEYARKRSDSSDVVVVLSHEAALNDVSALGVREVGHRQAQVYVDESFWVYLVPQKAINVSSRQ
jgi:hypothetical protein